MRESKKNFGSLKKRNKRMLHLMTRNSQCDVMPLDDGGRQIFIDESYTVADTAIVLANLVRRARTSRTARCLLTNASFARLGNEPAILEHCEVVSLNQWLRRALRIDTDMFRVYFPEHQVRTDIKVEIEAINAAQQLASHLSQKEQILTLLKEILKIGDALEHQTMRSRYRKASGDRLKETKAYLRALFAKCWRQLAVRVDLGYLRGDSPHGLGTVRSNLTFQQVTKHRERLMRAMRHKWGDAFTGYSLRLEWAPHKTFHIHLLALFNGYKVQGCVSCARAIGLLWSKVSDGVGTCWQPIPIPGQPRGTGMIRWDKPGEFDGLYETARYLCKEDHCIGFYKGDRERTFFHGKMEQ